MSGSRIKKSSVNAATAVLQNLLTIFLTFVSRMIFVQILDADYLGINGLFSNVLNVLALADLGMGTAMMYSLYKPIAQNDQMAICALIAFFKKVYLCIAFAVLLIGMALIPALPLVINLDTPVENLELYYFLALANVVSSYLFVYRTILATADQKGYVLSKYVILFKILLFAAQTIVLLVFRNYLLYLVAELIMNFLCNLVQNAAVVRMYPYLKNTAPKLEASQKMKIGKDVKSLFIYKVCGTIQGNTDNILISVISGTVKVGYYSNYLIIINAITSLITVAFTSVKASVGNLIACEKSSKGGEEQVYWILEFINYWLVGFSSVCLFCLFQDCIRIFFGAEFVLSMPVLLAIVINFYSINICQAIWIFRETTGLFHETKYIPLATAILNLILSVILGMKWEMFGILIATALSRFLYIGWREPMILFRQYFGAGLKKYFLNYLKRALLTVVVTFITYSLCERIRWNNPYQNFGCKVLVCAIVPNLCFILRFFRTKEFDYVWHSVIKPVFLRWRQPLK